MLVSPGRCAWRAVHGVPSLISVRLRAMSLRPRNWSSLSAGAVGAASGALSRSTTLHGEPALAGFQRQTAWPPRSYGPPDRRRSNRPWNHRRSTGHRCPSSTAPSARRRPRRSSTRRPVHTTARRPTTIHRTIFFIVRDPHSVALVPLLPACLRPARCCRPTWCPMPQNVIESTGYRQAIVHLAWIRDHQVRHLLFSMVELRPSRVSRRHGLPYCRTIGPSRRRRTYLHYRRFVLLADGRN